MTQAERRLPEQNHNVERVTLGNISFGVYLPEKFITNEQIETWGIQTQSGKLVTAGEIQRRIGIERRFIAGPNESVIDMGVEAARATGNIKDVDAILVSTSYPLGKNVSREIGSHLPIEPKFHLDFHFACSGFVRALAFLKEHERKYNNRRVLLVATEKYSHLLTDLSKGGIPIDSSMAQTIFSDGAAAIFLTYGKDIQVLEYENKKLPEESDCYIRMPIDENLRTDPSLAIPIPNSTNGKLQQEGPKVIEAISISVPDLNKRVIGNAGLKASDIKLLIPHQASGRMIPHLTKGMPEYKDNMFTDMEDGNFSSASIPKALARAIKEGRVQRGDKILLSAFGAGLYASSAIVELG